MSLSSEQPQTVNVVDVVRGIGRRKRLLALLTLAGLGIGLATVFMSKPSYQTEALVIVENTATSFERATSDQQLANAQQIDERFITSQVSVMKSGDLFGRVVDQLALQDNPELNPSLTRIGLLKSLLIAGGFADDPTQFTGRENAIKTMTSKVSVSGIQESNIISVTSRMNDKKAAADTANAVAEAYVASTRESDAGATDRARQWLGTQISDLRQKVSESENAVEKYRSEAGLLKGQTATLGTQQISELNSQITVAETAAGEAAARANEIKSLLASGSIEASSDVLNSPLMQNLREQQAGASRKVSELSAVYLPNHPKMIAAQKDLTAINISLKHEALKVVESLQGQAKVANERAQSLRNNLEKLKGRESEANVSDVKLKSLEREAQANRALLESMLSRYADASARQDTSQQPSKARIIQKAAVPPTPYFPKVGPTIFLTTLAGLALGLGLAFIMEVMSAAANANRGPRALGRTHVAYAQQELPMDIPPLLVRQKPIAPIVPMPSAANAISPVAHMSATGSRIAALELLASQESGSALAMEPLASSIASACNSLKDSRGVKAYSFFSFGCDGPDAALAALMAARTLSENKKRVVIIDVSQHGGDLELLAGLPEGTGLTDLIGGTADFTKIISRDPHSTVHVIRKGLSHDENTVNRVGEKLESVITALNSIYDFVFVHAGEAFVATPVLVKDCPGAFILATAKRQRDAVAAAGVLEGKGVTAPMFVQVNPAQMAEMRKAASA